MLDIKFALAMNTSLSTNLILDIKNW
jgi:hypothetical protein